MHYGRRFKETVRRTAVRRSANVNAENADRVTIVGRADADAARDWSALFAEGIETRRRETGAREAWEGVCEQQGQGEAEAEGGGRREKKGDNYRERWRDERR